MSPARPPRAVRLKSSFSRLVLLVVGLFVLWRFLAPLDAPTPVVPIYKHENTSLPPLYPALRDYERALPQHDENLPFPEGKGGTPAAKTIFRLTGGIG